MGQIRFQNEDKEFVELLFDDETDCEMTYYNLNAIIGDEIIADEYDLKILRLSIINLEYLIVNLGWDFELEMDPEIIERLQRFFTEQQQLVEPNIESRWNSESIIDHLSNNYDVKRTPTDFQLANLEHMLLRKSAASFSVPGSGKTSEGLCYWLCQKTENSKLLVVLPKVGFLAWEEEFNEWIGWGPEKVIRLDVPSDQFFEKIERNPNADVFLITYARLWRNQDQISQLMSNGTWSMILDESHNIKRHSGAYSRAVRRIGNYARETRLILTGTPAPQGEDDLWPQVEFLRNARLNASECVDWVQNVKVRTTKEQLGLLEPRFNIISRPLPESHHRLYRLLTSRLARQIESESDIEYSERLGSIRRHIMDIIRAASNPRILCQMQEFIGVLSPDIVRDVLETDSWKVQETIDIVNSLVSENRKVIIWSCFNENTDELAIHLSHLNPRIIRGSTPSAKLDSLTIEDEIEDYTREGILRDFKSNDDCRIIIANPAACGESISLHHWCHDAIYFDRNYNAGQFLQSCDRIHRYGKYPGTETITCAEQIVTYHILESRGTIDQRISNRLAEKIDNQNRILRLGDYSTPIEEVGTNSNDSSGMSNADREDLVEYLASYLEE
jgi:SNF2 family DNA or RNA helicase